MDRSEVTPLRHVKRDLIANLLSSIWAPLLWIVAVPQYISLMGAESFGLVGLFIVLQGMILLLDFGLSMTLNREFSRLSTSRDTRNTMRDTLRTMEVIYWGIAILIGLLIFGGSGIIAERWLRPESLPVAQVIEAIYMMAATLALLWPLTLYSGGLMGLQRQASLAAVNITFLTLRFIGVIPILWFFSASITTFFLYQAMVGAVHVSTVAVWLWKTIPGNAHRATFRLGLLRSQMSFALALTGFAVIEVVFSQADKIIVSKVLSLEMFGYYSVVALIATSLNRIFMPVFKALYPRFVQLLEIKNQLGLTNLYHRGCQIIAVLNFGVAIPIIVFSREVLFVWLGNYLIADATGYVLALLVIGSSIRGLVYLPHALQLAAGWTALGLKTSCVALVAFIPLLVFLTIQFGAIGAASAWVIVNAGYSGANIYLMHRRLLPDERNTWMWNDVALPLVGPTAVTVVAKFLIPEQMSRIEWGAALACIMSLSILLAAWGAPLVRLFVTERLFGKPSQT